MSNKRQRTNNNKSEIVFEYTGSGQTVPKDVVSVRFHPSVVEVEYKAFYNCSKLIEVILNNGLRDIGDFAFHNCTALQSITFPSTVTKIGSQAFHGCSNLRELVLNDGLAEIGDSAFVHCGALQSINMPSTVTKIGNEAFNNCTNLREVLGDGLRKIGCDAFSNCTSLQSIAIPSTVNEIGSGAFSLCANLRGLVLSDGIKKIKAYAFQDCTSLESITIPSTVTEIGDYAFSCCTRLREVVIHNDKVQIDDKAFLRCSSSLERFKFPRLLTRLDNIIQAGQRDIEAKMDDISAVEWRDGELSIPAVSREIERPWVVETLVEVDKEKLSKVKGLISYYELKEATALFELALWKAKIDQADISSSADRAACRVEVPGPVKDTIIKYLR